MKNNQLHLYLHLNYVWVNKKQYIRNVVLVILLVKLIVIIPSISLLMDKILNSSKNKSFIKKPHPPELLWARTCDNSLLFPYNEYLLIDISLLFLKCVSVIQIISALISAITDCRNNLLFSVQPWIFQVATLNSGQS